ncbi:MAG TPA: hypothetical protein VMS55_12440 [Myxococcota bacterium]|nr:hypothetical protein [Myxococcota bacterium]
MARFERIRPDAPQSALLRARLALARADASGARAQLERLAPELDTAATQYWLGRALEQTGDPAGAAHRMQLAAARDPAAPGPWLELLRLAQARGDAREAEQSAAGVVLRAPQLVAGWQGLVDAWIEQGRAADALATAHAPPRSSRTASRRRCCSPARCAPADGPTRRSRASTRRRSASARSRRSPPSAC